ncbi:hypothetical protein GQ457_14G012930 [Hibiscus cannabinus]
MDTNISRTLGYSACKDEDQSMEKKNTLLSAFFFSFFIAFKTEYNHGFITSFIPLNPLISVVEPNNLTRCVLTSPMPLFLQVMIARRWWPYWIWCLSLPYDGSRWMGHMAMINGWEMSPHQIVAVGFAPI